MTTALRWLMVAEGRGGEGRGSESGEIDEGRVFAAATAMPLLASQVWIGVGIQISSSSSKLTTD